MGKVKTDISLEKEVCLRELLDKEYIYVEAYNARINTYEKHKKSLVNEMQIINEINMYKKEIDNVRGQIREYIESKIGIECNCSDKDILREIYRK